ncbi:uncharacterized protein LOC120132464 [Hibiscus syriacus]|uniref:uncharacterized protein LOC120132464 n=1 Tax=Hibiscus syriacus TaxID=106335 RepID=UPI0019251289|nr:uncharacterized protein LOC120132464 [Hibiscus syriacus]
MGWCQLRAFDGAKAVWFYAVYTRDPWARSVRVSLLVSKSRERKIHEGFVAWKQTFYLEATKYTDGLTPNYEIWRAQRVNDKIVMPLDLQLRAVQLELNFVRQQSEHEKARLNEEIARLQEENRQVKGKRKNDTSKDDLGEFQLENKKLHLTTEDTRLGKSLKDWEKEISDLKGEREFWKNKSMKDEEKVVGLSQEVQTWEVVCSAVIDRLTESQRENEDLRALFEVEKETLLEGIRDLECSVQGHKDRFDSLLMTLDDKDREWQNKLHVSEEACCEKSIDRLVSQIRGVVRRVTDVSVASEAMKQEISQSGKHGQMLLTFLEEVKKQCDHVRRFSD